MAQKPKYNLKDVPTSKPLGRLSFDKPHSLHSHEVETIEKMRCFGDSVKCIAPNHKSNSKTPDIEWRNEYWEIKTIAGRSKGNIEHALAAAKKQSRNVIICVPKTKRNPETICHEVSQYFYGSKSIQKVLVIIGHKYCAIS